MTRHALILRFAALFVAASAFLSTQEPVSSGENRPAPTRAAYRFREVSDETIAKLDSGSQTRRLEREVLVRASTYRVTTTGPGSARRMVQIRWAEQPDVEFEHAPPRDFVELTSRSIYRLMSLKSPRDFELFAEHPRYRTAMAAPLTPPDLPVFTSPAALAGTLRVPKETTWTRLPGAETVSGRRCFRFDGTDPHHHGVYRCWVDESTGIIMKRREKTPTRAGSYEEVRTLTDVDLAPKISTASFRFPAGLRARYPALYDIKAPEGLTPDPRPGLGVSR